MIHTIGYWGHQETALMGHQDDRPLFNDKGSNVNCENFKEFTNLISEFDSELYNTYYHVKETQLIYQRRIKTIYCSA